MFEGQSGTALQCVVLEHPQGRQDRLHETVGLGPVFRFHAGAWIPSAAAGLAFVNLPGQFVGPLGELAGGIDLSLPVALGLAALLYLALLRLFPEPPCVYGPRGPRWVRAHGTRRAPAIATA